MKPPPDLPELRGYYRGADHVDVKTVESGVSLREFVAAALANEPAWVRLLFRARAVVAHALRLEHPGGGRPAPQSPDEIAFTPGTSVGFFTVVAAAEDRYLVAEAADRHLSAQLAFLAEPIGAGRTRFELVTIVHYRNWQGPVYFNLIRPFHHVVVQAMAKAGAAGWRQPAAA